MTEKELRELDNWIAEQVMDAQRFVGLKKRGYWYRPDAHGYTDRENEAWHLTREEAKKHEYPYDEPVTICEFFIPHYTTDPAAAMEVLKKCVEKSGWFDSLIVGQTADGNYFFGHPEHSQEGVALELAICLFAKKLFTR